MLFENAKMQVNFLKDVVSFRNPRSYFTLDVLYTKVLRLLRRTSHTHKRVWIVMGWLHMHGEGVAEIWEDGRPDAHRLAAMVRAHDLSSRPGTLIIMLRSHHAIASEICERKYLNGPVFVPDDCAIPKFAECIDTMEVTILCPCPSYMMHPWSLRRF